MSQKKINSRWDDWAPYFETGGAYQPAMTSLRAIAKRGFFWFRGSDVSDLAEAMRLEYSSDKELTTQVRTRLRMAVEQLFNADQKEHVEYLAVRELLRMEGSESHRLRYSRLHDARWNALVQLGRADHILRDSFGWDADQLRGAPLVKKIDTLEQIFANSQNEDASQASLTAAFRRAPNALRPSPGWELEKLAFILDRMVADVEVEEVADHEIEPPVGVVSIEPERERVLAARAGTVHGRGTAPGTCGEFAQGLLPDGTEFHVTCPINVSATIAVEIESASEFEIRGLRVDQTKLDLAIRRVAELLGVSEVRVNVRRWAPDLDIAKGMGSSTADVLAGIRAFADAFKTVLDPATEAELATGVESSDGVMYPGIAVVGQKSGELIRQWGWQPEFVIVMLVPHRVVATESIAFERNASQANEYKVLLDRFDEAVASRSVEDFAAIATEAAEMNSRNLVNTYQQVLAPRLDEFGALGLNVGHTGSVCGLLYPNTQEGRSKASETELRVRREFPELKDVTTVTTRIESRSQDT